MSREPMPFDHRPDPVIGAALRRALEPGDEAGFVARLLARLETVRPRYWEVLASWARVGIAAAVVAALVGGFTVGRALRASASLDDAIAAGAGGPPASALLTAQRPPDAGVVFATLVER